MIHCDGADDATAVWATSNASPMKEKGAQRPLLHDPPPGQLRSDDDLVGALEADAQEGALGGAQ
jgi:hypothetical protein